MNLHLAAAAIAGQVVQRLGLDVVAHVEVGHGGRRLVGDDLRLASVEDGGGTAFADYIWKLVVLIEMKKRGENLQKHYRQAFDYWTRLVPNRPRYVVLCNFDEFRVYDFDTDLDTRTLQLAAPSESA